MRGLLFLTVTAVFGVLLLTGCGGAETQKALPETVVGSTPAATTEQTTTGETTTGQATTGETTTGETTTGETKPAGNATAGKQVFLSAGCTGCHTLKDAGSTGTVGPNLDDAKPDYDLVVDRVTNGAGAMPSFKGRLSDKQIQDVAAYVSSAAGKS